MPNLCKNIVRAPKEVLEDLYDGQKVTFEKLIPMPKSLNLTEGTITDTAIAYAMSKKAPSEFTRLKNEFEKIKISYHGNLWNKYKEHCTFENIEKLEQSAKRYIPGDDEKKLEIKGLYELGNLYIDNILKYGSATWYDWCCKNWGTKWNAMDSEGTPEEGEISFFTAWEEPLPIIKKLFEKHENKEIEWYFEGECCEYHGRYYSDGNGNIKKEYHEINYEEEQ